MTNFSILASIFIEIYYHIRIVPVSRSSIRNNVVLVVTIVVDNALNAGPRVLDVVKVAPQVAVLDD
jgi:hypothetical protein